MLWVELCSSHPTKKKKDVVLTPSNHECDLIWKWVFANDQVKMRSSGWILICYDWCRYKKEKFGQKQKGTQGKCLVKMIEEIFGIYKQINAEDCQPTTRREAGSMKQILSHRPEKTSTLILHFQLPQLWDDKFLLLKPPSSRGLVMAALAHQCKEWPPVHFLEC